MARLPSSKSPWCSLSSTAIFNHAPTSLRRSSISSSILAFRTCSESKRVISAHPIMNADRPLTAAGPFSAPRSGEKSRAPRQIRFSGVSRSTAAQSPSIRWFQPREWRATTRTTTEMDRVESLRFHINPHLTGARSGRVIKKTRKMTSLALIARIAKFCPKISPYLISRSFIPTTF